MSLYLDHVFVICEPGAASADRFSELGWVEGPGNSHPGQGTSNRRFFFQNFVLEFLYISDVQEALNGAGRRLGLLRRSEDTNASPFGLIVRVVDSEQLPQFPAWCYYPDYFDGKMCFLVGDNSDCVSEPLCICMPPKLPKAVSIPGDYDNAQWQFSEIEVDLPTQQKSKTLNHFSRIENVMLTNADSHNLTLTFNNGTAGKVRNFHPDIPLVVKW